MNKPQQPLWNMWSKQCIHQILNLHQPCQSQQVAIAKEKGWNVSENEFD